MLVVPPPNNYGVGPCSIPGVNYLHNRGTDYRRRSIWVCCSCRTCKEGCTVGDDSHPVPGRSRHRRKYTAPWQFLRLQCPTRPGMTHCRLGIECCCMCHGTHALPCNSISTPLVFAGARSNAQPSHLMQCVLDYISLLAYEVWSWLACIRSSSRIPMPDIPGPRWYCKPLCTVRP